MTTIKPPGSGPSASPADLAQQARELQDADPVAPAASGEVPSGVEGASAVVEALEAGRVDGPEAMAQMVEDVVRAQGLPEAAAAELRDLLNDAIASDPTLAVLAGELGDGG